MSILEGGFLDNGKNPLKTISVNSSLQISSYLADLSTPILASFVLDMDTSTLTLTWSENVVLDTIDVSGITIQSMRNLMNSNGHYYTLTNATSFYGLLYNILHIRISKFDEDMIKADVNLANSIDSTFISLTRGVIYDIEI